MSLSFEGWTLESEEFARARFTVWNHGPSLILLRTDSFGTPFSRREAVREDDPIVFGGTVCASGSRDVHLGPEQSLSFSVGASRMDPDFYLFVDPRAVDGTLLEPVRSEAVHNPIRRRREVPTSSTPLPGKSSRLRECSPTPG